MAQGFKHRETRVLEGSSMAVGGEGGALWRLGKRHIWHAKVRFYLVLIAFQKGGCMQAPKELTLSVLRR